MDKHQKKPKEKDEDVVLDKDESLDDSVVSEENSLETIKKLRAKLREAEKKASDYLSGWQRTQADFINYKKRALAEREEFVKYASEPLLLDIINVLDSFEMAFSDKNNWNKVDEVWRDGMLLIYNQLKKVLEKNNVITEDPLGEKFDPMNHLAIATSSTDKVDEDGKILEVFQKGYSLHGKVIRPAKVKIGQLSHNN